jgi:hypothetical protein
LLTLLWAGAASGQVKVRTDDGHLQGDLATRIEAAEKELGTRKGEIIITGNEPITRTVVVGPGHTWNVSGMHTLVKGANHQGLVWMKDGSTLLSKNNGGFQNDVTGLSRPRMIETYEGMQPFKDARFPADYDARVGSNITVEGIQLKDIPGANPSASINAALNFGNCHNCKASKVWFNGLNDFGVQVGGHALWADKYADGVQIVDCLFTKVATQNIAWVHGQNGLIARNKFVQSGRPNQVHEVIDIEANYSPYSFLKRIKVIDNVIDFTETAGSYGGIAVTSSAATVPTEDIEILRNTLIGKSTIAGALSRKGIETAGDDLRSPDGKRITIADNNISDFNQICIVAAGDQIQVLRNTLKNCSWGLPTSGILATDLTNSVIKDNHISGRLAELGFQNVRKKNANNLVEGNTLARIIGTYTTTTFRNNVISGAQNTGDSIYHSGIKEFPGSTGNVYENNKITRGNGGNQFGLQVQPGSSVKSVEWLEAVSKGAQ